MSKLGYIYKSYGDEFKGAISNTYGYVILNSTNLPKNALIIASPVDDDNNDTGTYSLLVTDYLSNPIRLTYTIKEGNGLVYSDDSLKIKIDNKTIIENDNKELSINISYIIDNDTIKYDSENDNLYISYDNFNRVSSGIGLFKVDENTIKVSDDYIYIDTSSLRYANENTKISGIVKGDGYLISVDQGIISLNQENLSKATEDNPGLIYSTNDTINISNGIISVNTADLNVCENDSPGIAIPDNDTIYLDNELLSVNTNNLLNTSSSNFGVFSYDPETFNLENDILSVRDNDIILNDIDNIIDNTSKINNLVNDVEYLLTEYQVGLSKPSIFDFHCSQLLTSVLEKPMVKNEKIDEMPTQFVSVTFMITTNCPFKISVKFENNLDPQFSLHEINYNDTFIYNGNEGLETVYQTTENLNIPIKITFIGKNYFNADNSIYSDKTKIKITVSYSNDASIYKEILYSIIRFNSGFSKNIEYDDENLEMLV